MILKKIVPSHFGPFAYPTPIEVEETVTVLTGANDTGKSSVLRLIEMISRHGQPDGVAAESDVNHDRLTPDREWSRDESIECEAEFQASSWLRVPSQGFGGAKPVHDGDLIRARFQLAPGCASRVIHTVVRNGNETKVAIGLEQLPKAILLADQPEINATINIKRPSPTETTLLNLAFGMGFQAASLSALSEALYRKQLIHAQERLAAALNKVFPSGGCPKIQLDKLETRDQLGVFMMDPHEGFTSLGVRGRGVRRILTLLALVLGTDMSQDHHFILVDEPENSLHADLQHLFRSLLEELADRQNVQVIYATHSSSMINTTRPWSIRLLRRTTRDSVATTEVVRRSADGNWLPVRSSLGISPADSLLYSPFTLIVEGPSEAYALPRLLQRLRNDLDLGLETIDGIFSDVHIIDAGGDKFEHACRLAKTQGAKPLLFLDGDKRGQANTQRVEEQHADVPIVYMPDADEFEQIIPEARYFAALAECIGVEEDLQDAFNRWESDNPLRAGHSLAFTKRVARWLSAAHPSATYNKVAVMRRAAETVPTAEVRLDVINEVVEALKRLKRATSGASVQA